MLVIFGGLPGTGKSTIAKDLAGEIKAVYLRIDSIEQTFRESIQGPDDIGPAGYMAAYRLAEDNLKIGHTVVADSVNPLGVTRCAWRKVADDLSSPYFEVEVICSDEKEHRHRVENRTVDIKGLRPPTWKEVVDREYESWESDPLILDTAKNSVSECVALIVESIGSLKL